MQETDVMENKRGATDQPFSGNGTVGNIIRKARLSWRLLRDKRVSTTTKLIPLMGLVYVIWPIDILPDVVPALGQLDDVAILILAMNWFIKACPTDIVNEVKSERSDQDVISANYTVIDDDRDQRDA